MRRLALTRGKQALLVSGEVYDMKTRSLAKPAPPKSPLAEPERKP